MECTERITVEIFVLENCGIDQSGAEIHCPEIIV